MGMYRALACAFGALVACSFTPSGDGSGGDDDAAVGDDAAGDDAAPGVDAVTPDAPATTDAAPPDAGCVETCSGDDAITCSGGTPMSERCDLGCSTTGGVHCRVMVPSNLPDASDLTGVTAGLTFAPAQDYYLLTDTGEIVYDVGGTRMTLRAAGGDVAGTRFRVVSDTLAVLAVDTFTLPATARVYGFGNRALIVLARNAITVGGEIDFSAGCFLGQTFTRACGGPGAGDGGTSAAVNGDGCAGGTGGSDGGNETGGAGGGFATAGGNGGGAPGKTTPAAAAITGCPGPALVPLLGGGGGGAGAPSGSSVGGGGGGALQLTSLTSVTLSAVSASDRATFFMAGAGGKGTFTTNRGGGGGGAGGAVLIEAPAVTVTSALFACGGGGGAGGRVTTLSSTTDRDGGWGRRDGMQAPGGVGDNMGGFGGAGGTPTAAAQNGAGNVDGTGGGGGGIGRVRVNNLAGAFTMPASARVTASYSSGQINLQ